MDTELKEQWVNALRSGDYKQGTGALRDENDQYCCLGVLCDIVQKKEYDLNWEIVPGPGHKPAVYSIGGNTGYLPAFVYEKCDVDQKQQEVLVDLNDADSADFNGIADWIEENL